MAEKMSGLEVVLDDLFVRNSPRLPRSGRKALVAWMPVITLFMSIISLASTWGLWHWAHSGDKFIGACNAYSVSGCGNTIVSRFSTWLWVALVFMALEGILYLLAFPGLTSRTKSSWNLLYYALLVNIVYAVASLFTYYNRVLHFLAALLGSTFGLYVLFQVRRSYTIRRRATTVQAAPNPGSNQLANSFEKPRKQ